jgi:phage shock protein A
LTEARQVLNGESNTDRLTSLLDDAQRQLDVLRLELSKAVSHQKRIERACKESAAQATALDTAADEAIRAGQDDRARQYLSHLQSMKQQVSDLEELARAGEKHSTDLRIAVNRQQEQLNTLRRRALALSDRERSVTTLAELLGDQQGLARQTEKLQTELSEWEEQIARREDYLSARREWNK